MTLYVLGVHNDGTSWVLEPEANTRAQCERVISWQVRGGGKREDWRICEFIENDDQGPVFDCEGVTYHPTRSPYTEEAWAHFCANFRNRPHFL